METSILNGENTLQWVIFILMIIILTLYYPISGYFQQKKLTEKAKEGINIKIIWYRDTIIWAWVPVAFILLLIPFSSMHFEDMGFKMIDLRASSSSNWIVFPVIGLYIIYLLYNIYSILILKYSKESRVKSAEQIPDDFRYFLPVTKEEKKTWILVAISAGITEELIYRAYLFYALGLFFPDLSLMMILLISTILFGIGHIYQGTEVIKPVLIGLFLGLFYIIFDSIIPVMIIHILQDLVVKYLLEPENTSNQLCEVT